MLFYTLLLITYIIPVEAGNIIFSSPTPGTKISAGNALAVRWDITVDSGDLTLESASGNSVSPKLLTSGLDGKSFTWTPTESDLSPFAGSGTVLRLLDRKDSARTGVSGTFNVDSPQKAPAPVSSSTPVVVVSTSPAPQPTSIIINTIITTSPQQSTPSSSPTPTPTSDPPKPSSTDSTFLPTTNNDPTTLISSTISSSPTSDSSTNSQTPPAVSSTLTRSLSDPSTNSQAPTYLTTVAGSPQPTSTSIDPPTTPTLTPPIKTAIAVTSTFSVFFLLIVLFYFGKRTAKNNSSLDPQTQNNIQSFLRRAISRPKILKPELDSESSEILELAAIKEKEFFEVEGRGLAGKKRSVAELQGDWEGVELEDTSKREGSTSPCVV